MTLGAFVATLATNALAADAGCTSSVACEECDVSGYAPTQMAKPIGPSTQACADSDISAFVTACLGSSSSSTTCSSWQGTAPTACESCLFTQDTASSWGLLVCTTTGCSINIPGCVNLELGQVSQEKQAGGSGSCGDAFNASYGCQDYACGACSTTDFSTCDNDALTNECKSYDAPVESTTGPCAVLNGDAAPSAVMTCFAQSDSDYVALATYICGGGTSTGNDAGATDGGPKSDGGKDGGSVDAGGDGGSSSNGGGGCHCDAAGVGSNDNALATIASSVLVAIVVRRRKRVSRA